MNSINSEFEQILLAAKERRGENTGKVYMTYVDQWLDTLPASESEEFKEFAEVTFTHCIGICFQ